jgi:hypothetical protein
MGDGQHAWASAEWVLMIRNMFVREEGERLVLAAGILPEWLEAEGPISFGPAPTSFGEVRVEITRRDRRAEVQWSGSWRGVPVSVEVRLPGFAAVDVAAGQGSALLEPEGGP